MGYSAGPGALALLPQSSPAETPVSTRANILILGAFGAIWFVLAETHSSISDVGGAIDVILMLVLAAAGAVVAGILVYTLESLLFRRPPGLHAH